MTTPSLILGAGPQCSGLLYVTRGVREFFGQSFVQTKYAQERVKTPAVTITSWKAREIQLNQDVEGGNRIAFMPGWGLSKRSYGAIEDPDQLDSSPRTLGKWPLKCTASIWAVDNADTDDDERQWGAVERMVECFRQAVQYATVRDATTTTRVKFGELYDDEFSTNRHYGVELLVPMTVKVYLRDIPFDQVVGATVQITKEPFGTKPAD